MDGHDERRRRHGWAGHRAGPRRTETTAGITATLHGDYVLLDSMAYLDHMTIG